jgi:hypothetical protein
VRVRCGTCAARVESLRARVLAQARQVICQPDLVLARPSATACREDHRGPFWNRHPCDHDHRHPGQRRRRTPEFAPWRGCRRAGSARAGWWRRSTAGRAACPSSGLPAQTPRFLPVHQPGPEIPRHPFWLDPAGCPPGFSHVSRNAARSPCLLHSSAGCPCRTSCGPLMRERSPAKPAQRADTARQPQRPASRARTG